MAGRNSKPKKNGPASSPNRLDQFGSKAADDTAPVPMSKNRRSAEDC